MASDPPPPPPGAPPPPPPPAPPPPPPAPPPPPPDPERLPTTKRAWGEIRVLPMWIQVGSWAMAALIVAGIIGASVGAGENETATITTERSTTTERQTTTESTTTTTAAPTTTTAPPPPPTTAITASPPPPPSPAPAPVPAPAPAPPSGCHPSYDPCVPIAPDVDCRGGSGDGPDNTGTVTVIGPDVYGLDGDSDGVGCE